MKASEMSYKELKAKPKELNVEGYHKMNTEALVEALNGLGVFNSAKRGRPVNPESAHAKKMAKKAEMEEAGIEIKRGRPVDPNSKRQKHLAAVEAGLVKRGRPANPESAHYKRQQELEAKRAANGGVIPLGRPKAEPSEDAPEA